MAKKAAKKTAKKGKKIGAKKMLCKDTDKDMK
jgi:hypothetical protein